MASRIKRGRDKKRPTGSDLSTLMIRLRGRDNEPLSMFQLRDALMQVAQLLAEHEIGYRVKSASVYLTMIDRNGDPVRLNEDNTVTIHAYKAAADEFGV